MREVITLKRKASLKARYHALLTEDWNGDEAEAILHLLDEQLSSSGARLSFPWENACGRRHSRRATIFIGSELLNELLQVLRRVGPLALPSASKQTDSMLAAAERSPQTTMAIRSCVYLALQAIFDLRGDTELFRDLQSLLFLRIVDGTLPALQAADLGQEHDLLVSALGYHCTIVWQDDAAHQQYLLSILARYLGDRQLEEKALLACYRLTDPEEHNFLTLAQSYWFLLAESGRHDDAKAFLLDAYRKAPREALEEIREMISEAFEGDRIVEAHR